MDCGWDKKGVGPFQWVGGTLHTTFFLLYCLSMFKFTMNSMGFSRLCVHAIVEIAACSTGKGLLACFSGCNQWIPQNFVCGSDRTAVWKTFPHLNELYRKHLTPGKMNLDTAKCGFLEGNCTPKSGIGSKVRDLSIAGCSCEHFEICMSSEGVCLVTTISTVLLAGTKLVVLRGFS